MKSKTEEKSIDENGYPIPRQVKCFKCEKIFWLKFVVPQQNYSKKNYWKYWTEKEEDRDKFVCSPCLRNFYFTQRKEFLATVKNLKKRNNLRSYVSDKFI